MGEAIAIALLGAATLLWADSLRAREKAVSAGREACERYGLQFLDDTVSIARVRLARDDEGRLRISRTYRFEFSDTGDNRRAGAVTMFGARVYRLQLEPYPLA